MSSLLHDNNLGPLKRLFLDVSGNSGYFDVATVNLGYERPDLGNHPPFKTYIMAAEHKQIVSLL